MRGYTPPVPPERCQTCGAPLEVRGNSRCVFCRRLDRAGLILEQIVMGVLARVARREDEA